MIHSPRLEVLVATGNPGKIREIQELLRGFPVKLRLLREFQDISPVDEIGETYQENATLKALSYAKQAGLWALADDSGLEVDALNGRPGVLSARYGGVYASDEVRTENLLMALTQLPREKRSARFICCMVLAGWPLGKSLTGGDDPQVLHACEGKCEGHIVEEPRGNNGFGYDPVFVPSGYEETLAELPSRLKNVISHRGQALAAMRAFLNRWIA